MDFFATKDRFVRVLPGRIRAQICGIKNNAQLAETFKSRFACIAGVHKADACSDSGRVLIVFDERRISLAEMLKMIRVFEDNLMHTDGEKETGKPAVQSAMEPDNVQDEVAAASEAELKLDLESFKSMPIMPPQPAGNETIPLPLALSMGGLAVLGMKQLFMGRSALARSPAPFYLSAAISVITGYPFLRRGIQSYSQEKKLNSDLILGAGALALALIRENLIVLGGLSILQYVNWKRTQAAMDGQQGNIRLSPEIAAYSDKAGKIGMIAAGATWALTRNPLRAIAVLLAANPRPATIPAECAWSQAELVCKERNLTMPEKGSLSELPYTKSVLVEDSALLFDKHTEEVKCISDEEDGEDKIICLAASLMEKSNHPWKEEIWYKAKQTCRTVRTAFRVEEEEEGIKGKINDVPVYAGTIRYMQRHGIDCSPYLLEIKRLERRGCDVLVVAKLHKASDGSLGLLFKPNSAGITEFGNEVLPLVQKGWNIGILKNSLAFNPDQLSKLGIRTDWSLLEEGEIIERLAVMRQRGENALLVVRDEPSPVNDYLNAAGVPTIAAHRFRHLLTTVSYATTIDETVHQHLHLTRKWNIVGSALASFGILSAPIVNLAADALSFVFLSRTKRISEDAAAPMIVGPSQEIAAASEAIGWHAMPWKDVTSQFRVDYQRGLSDDQIHSLRNQYGANQLNSKQPVPWIVTYIGQFKEFTTLILLGTAALAFFTGGWFDGIAMGTVLLANAAISTLQERKAEKVFETLNKFQPPVCKMIRNGQEQQLSAAELVPGDIVCLEAGDRVPADIRLIRGWNLEVNESALTGESVPTAKNEEPVEPERALTDRKNMLYMGTDVSRGKAVGIVVQSGMRTEMGHLVALLKQDDKELTPLQGKVTSISKAFMKGALVAGGLVFIAGLIRGIPLTQMITSSITLAASAIPEGLPVTITIALSAGILRTAKKNSLIRKLSALETLGRTTIICTDKTGTLTKNEMTVKTVATVNKLWTVSGTGYEPVGEITEISGEAAAACAILKEDEETGSYGVNPELQRIVQIGVLCNNSKLEQKENQWVIKGDPTEGALLALAGKTNVWQEGMSQWERVVEVPFDSNSAKMSVVCKDTLNGKDCFVFCKGAVESILRVCSKYQRNGEVFDLSEEQKRQILSQNEALSADALRVLAFAYRPVEGSEGECGADEKDLIYVGIVGMADPPKPDVDRNIREAQELGVKPVMITGDHPITAISIAKQLGIYDGNQQVVSGHELDRMSDEELHRVVDEVSIFARVTPEHKLRIVTALQKRGHIVAMTGDGVNDTPAIKQANVGIAMGRTGTEVTKETADMILKEDDFGTIVDGVKEGRTVIGNIRKALGCLLTGNLAEIIVTCTAIVVGLPIPLIPIQILLMNLLTDALPAMILAVNPGNKTKQTKRTDIVDKELYQKVITKGVLLGIGSLGLFAATLASGAPIAVAQTAAFATLVAGQLMQTFSWRQEGSEESIQDWSKDRFLLGALGISWLALLAAIYVPPVAGFFHTVPLSARQWLPVLLVAGSVSFLSKPILSLLHSKNISIRPSLRKMAPAAA